MTLGDRAVGDKNALCGIIGLTREFADPDFQRRVWISGEGPECSSYTEAICRLFDDYHVVDFVDGDASKYGFTAEMLDGLRAFVTAIEEFELAVPRRLNDSEIVALPGWAEVMGKAAAFLDVAVVWAQQNCSGFAI